MSVSEWQHIGSAPKNGTPVKLGLLKESGKITESCAYSWTFVKGEWLGDYKAAGYRATPCPFTPTHWRYPTPNVNE